MIISFPCGVCVSWIGYTEDEQRVRRSEEDSRLLRVFVLTFIVLSLL